MTARIVLLNGVGSAGKSSIAKALQAIASQPFLHVQMDAFLEMLPEALEDHADGFSYDIASEDGVPAVAIRTGAAGERLLRGMRRAVAALAEEGNNLIVDEVLSQRDGAGYAKLLSPYDLMMVGVYAPLDILEARERERGDRIAGLARWQYERVHRGMRYDFEVDTSAADAMTCAARIKERFGL